MPVPLPPRSSESNSKELPPSSSSSLLPQQAIFHGITPSSSLFLSRVCVCPDSNLNSLSSPLPSPIPLPAMGRRRQSFFCGSWSRSYPRSSGGLSAVASKRERDRLFKASRVKFRHAKQSTGGIAMSSRKTFLLPGISTHSSLRGLSFSSPLAARLLGCLRKGCVMDCAHGHSGWVSGRGDEKERLSVPPFSFRHFPPISSFCGFLLEG